jgi:hypothetical protein
MANPGNDQLPGDLLVAAVPPGARVVATYAVTRRSAAADA